MAILERITGFEPSSLSPWQLDQAAQLARAVGRVVVGSGFGTGFLVTPRLLLTCAHVIPDLQTALRSAVEFDYVETPDGVFGPVTRIALDPDSVFVTDRALDCTIVGLASESRDRPCIPLASDGRPLVGERIILYHHPKAGPLRVSLGEGQIVGEFSDRIHHTSNTQPGSAGGPVLDEAFRLLGVHHAHVPSDGARRIVNEAVRASAIREFVARTAPSLFDDGGRGPSRVLQAQGTSSGSSSTKGLSNGNQEVADASAKQVRDSVFISYAHADQGDGVWRDRLRDFLKPLTKSPDIWDDSRIKTGANWRAEIDLALGRASVAVLLIGPKFLASDFIANNELPPLLKAAAEEGVAILPLITNYCSYERTALGGYQSFNDPEQPLEAMPKAEQNKALKRFAEQVADAAASHRQTAVRSP